MGWYDELADRGYDGDIEFRIAEGYWREDLDDYAGSYHEDDYPEEDDMQYYDNEEDDIS